MKVNGINSFASSFTQSTEKKSSGDFKELLSSFVKDVNNSEKKAQELTKDFVLGKDVPIHEVMIAGEKAKTNLELLVEIRNKAIETYKELTKMQI